MPTRYEQSYEFSFEAAHELGGSVSDDARAAGHAYARLHGHSFVATVTLSASSLENGRWIVDFAQLKAACARIAERLDHRLLNEIEGLDTPTLENIAAWIFHEIAHELPMVAAVSLARPTLRERVVYSAGA